MASVLGVLPHSVMLLVLGEGSFLKLLEACLEAALWRVTYE